MLYTKQRERWGGGERFGRRGRKEGDKRKKLEVSRSIEGKMKGGGQEGEKGSRIERGCEGKERREGDRRVRSVEGKKGGGGAWC